jgi:uncharacterized protein (TIGR00369 family)
MEKARLPERLAPDLTDRLRARFAGFGVIQGWGLEILEMGPGRAHLRIRANERTSNPGGDIINGGVLAALGDMSSALALSTAFDGAMPFVTSDLNIRYLEPARGDVEAEATVLRLSHRSAIIACEFSCGEEMVALCTSHFSVKRKLAG